MNGLGRLIDTEEKKKIIRDYLMGLALRLACYYGLYRVICLVNGW